LRVFSDWSIKCLTPNDIDLIGQFPLIQHRNSGIILIGLGKLICAVPYSRRLTAMLEIDLRDIDYDIVREDHGGAEDCQRAIAGSAVDS